MFAKNARHIFVNLRNDTKIISFSLFKYSCKMHKRYTENRQNITNFPQTTKSGLTFAKNELRLSYENDFGRE